MKLSHLSVTEQQQLLRQPFFLQVGTFTVSINTTVQQFIQPFIPLYQDYSLSFSPQFADFHVELVCPVNAHRFFKPQVQFLLDGRGVFNPLPLNQALPIFEWGLNWAIGNHCHFYLVVHAGVVEKNGFAVLLPGTPAAGKSTLCAALSLSGWRLLSDELALIDLESGLCWPMARPVSLKDQSIDVIRQYHQGAVLSNTFHDTQKGSVAYLKVPHVPSNDPAIIRSIVFPNYQRELNETLLEPVSKARALIRVAEQSFNYHIHGRRGFEQLKCLVEPCCCYDFYYNGDLTEALPIFNRIADGFS